MTGEQSRTAQEELPGALLVLVAHNDVFLIGTEGWTQAARIRVEVYSVLWDVHQGRFQDLLDFHYCSDIVAFSLDLLHFSPDDWGKPQRALSEAADKAGHSQAALGDLWH